jgi:outer membrane protein insertion porin family
VGLRFGLEAIDGDPSILLDPAGDRRWTFHFTLFRDRRSSTSFPFRGSYLSAEAGWIGPDRNDRLREVRLDGRWFLPVVRRNVLALQLFAHGLSGEAVPVYRWEHLGGAATLRGYDYGRFTGKKIAVGTAEYRVPINFSMDEPVEDLLLGLEVHLFGEVGAAWTDVLDRRAWRGSFGVGLSLLAPNASALRFDFAWTPRTAMRWEVDGGLKF